MGCLVTLGLSAGMAVAQDDAARDAIAERLKPVGELCLQGEDCGTAMAAASSGGDSGGGAIDGEGIYNNVCMACHETGAAGAPVRGDEAAWSERTGKGFETLVSHAINGFNAMPAKGGNPGLSDEEVQAAVAHLVDPVMDVPAQESGSDSAEGGEAMASAEPATAGIDGEAIYGSVCMACHDTGAAGAPKRGDAEAWAPRLEKGTETLYSHAINGFNAMPAKGGNPNLSDAEVQAAVDHLIGSVQ
ncbi:cytochrome c5 family protein [Halomonas aestuarii]|uniref:Cytochrome c5 family protein n=2 Tax=Halomonas aestuarii TaxID=1897729 RepID=A0A1J0VKG9_9GAMM|nr:cytochrome c5 family protein [Halomonas aestuarii]